MSDKPDIRDQQIASLRTVLESLLTASQSADRPALLIAQKRAKMALGIAR